MEHRVVRDEKLLLHSHCASVVNHAGCLAEKHGSHIHLMPLGRTMQVDWAASALSEEEDSSLRILEAFSN